MLAGSTHTIKVLLDWNRHEEVTKDWSLTAWGEKGAVSVTHDSDIATQHMPSSGLWEDGLDYEDIPDPDPIPVPPICHDLDNGLRDDYDDPCYLYFANT